MAASIPTQMIRDLRHEIARAIEATSAPKVAAQCERLGLHSDLGDDPWSGKYKYAERRLIKLSIDELVACGRKLLEEDEHFGVQEQLSKIEELNGHALTSLTRRRLLDFWKGSPLSPRFTDFELLSSIWPKDLLIDSKVEFIEAFDFPGSKSAPKKSELSAQEMLSRSGFMTCSRRLVFQLIETVTSPEAQSEADQSRHAIGIDEILRKDGYTLAAGKKMAGSPTYAVRLLPAGSPADAAISATLSAFDPTQVHARWEAALDRRAEDPEGAITLARTLLEDVCKWILDQAGENWDERDDLPILYRKLAKRLKLAPDEYTEEVFKKILGSCQNVVESLGTLRNRLGDAHSTGPKRTRPQPRHAELAVNLAGAMATFLVSTWEMHRKDESS